MQLSHLYNLGRQSKIIVCPVASLTERFVENEPLWKPCLWKEEYIRSFYNAVQKKLKVCI